MARRPNPYLIDDDNPELTEKELAAMKPAIEMLPLEVYEALVAGEPGRRGPGKQPAKVPMTIRVDPETLAAFKAAGPGWQAKVNTLLRKAATRPPFDGGRPSSTIRKRA